MKFVVLVPALPVLLKPADRAVKDVLIVRNVENGRWTTAWSFREPVGISGARTEIQVRLKLGFGDNRQLIGDVRLDFRELNFLAVLQRQLDRPLQS